MPLNPHQLHQLPLPHLHAHPLHPRRISPTTLHKLRAHIERTHHYEPLLVRPHPTLLDHYQIIHGHHRHQALAALNHPHAACLIWHLTDAEALTLLATLNTLAGREVATKRLALLESLANEVCHAQAVCHAQGSGPLSMLPIATEAATAKSLAALLPESPRTLTAMLTAHTCPPIAPAPPPNDLPEAFTLFLKAQDKRRLLAALKQIHPDKTLALLTWLNSHELPPTKPAVSDGAG